MLGNKRKGKKMSGFDDLGLFFVDTFATDDGAQDATKLSLMSVKKKLKDFLRVFHTGNFNYVYRFANHQMTTYLGS